MGTTASPKGKEIDNQILGNTFWAAEKTGKESIWEMGKVMGGKMGGC